MQSSTFQECCSSSIRERFHGTNALKDGALSFLHFFFICSDSYIFHCCCKFAIYISSIKLSTFFLLPVSLPRFIVVPQKVLDTELKKSFAHFNEGRIPVSVLESCFVLNEHFAICDSPISRKCLEVYASENIQLDFLQTHAELGCGDAVTIFHICVQELKKAPRSTIFTDIFLPWETFKTFLATQMKKTEVPQTWCLFPKCL